MRPCQGAFDKFEFKLAESDKIHPGPLEKLAEYILVLLTESLSKWLIQITDI